MKEQIRRSVTILEQNIQNIRSVSEWAYLVGFRSSKSFSRLFRNEFGIRPKAYLDRIRIEEIKNRFLEMPDVKYYCIALEVGLEDEQALYKFVKNHLGISPTELKKHTLESSFPQMAA